MGTEEIELMTDNVNNVKNLRVEPNKISSKGKAMGPGDNFDSLLGAMAAMEPMNTELMYQATGSSNAAAVLHGAFTGVTGAASAYGYGGVGGSPYAAAGGYGGYGGFGALSEYPGMMGVGSYGTSGGYVTGGKGLNDFSSPLPSNVGGSTQAGTGLPTQELINSMNVNNLKLLELQAVMQSNMQAWNTKSNILSADHRARMAMIEKFTARG
jgi:hypothetical protein